jgi:NAD(P)-dependent dehydrogenase (short-subunit alcohol dehydrogenase family)
MSSSKILGDQSMMQDFAGKTALVTGSNSGTGKAAAQQPAERGAHVMPSGPDTARGAAPAAETRLAEVTEVRNVIVIGPARPVTRRHCTRLALS